MDRNVFGYHDSLDINNIKWINPYKAEQVSPRKFISSILSVRGKNR